MGKVFIVVSTLFLIIFTQIPNVYAQEIAAGSSAIFSNINTQETSDSRVRILREFLEKYNSPLVPFAKTFVDTADKYDIDWKLVAAISGVESTFGQQIPVNSFNGWGWGIYGDNMIRFSSWNEGIETVSKGLKTRYIDDWGAENVYEIGRYYAASPTWAQRVEYFMNKIEEYGNSILASLPISL